MSSPPKPSTILAGVSMVIGILILLVLNKGADLLHFLGFRQMNDQFVFISRSLFWLFLILIWLYSVRVERQKLLIWEEKKYKFWQYALSIIAITVALFVALALALSIIRAFVPNKESSELLRGMNSIFKSNKLLLVYTALTAGITEELIFRGYLLPRLEILIKKPVPAIFISALLFGAAHYRYGTVVNVVDAFIIGLALSFYYWEYRNIKVLIIFHFLWDLSALYLLTKHG